MPRRKLLLVDHPFHAQTRSSRFFQELLSTRFDVVVDYLEAHPNDVRACAELVRQHEPELVVLWQVAFRARALLELGLPVTWVPMFDQSRRRWHQNYLEATQAGVNVLAFSRAVGGFARSWRLPCVEVQYYPLAAPSLPATAEANRLLLWFRGGIQPKVLFPIVAGIPDLRVVIKNDIDPSVGEVQREDGELAPFIERVVEGFVPDEEYRDLLNICGLFAAPRQKEGIGLSFLDAMARGALVIGFNAPTMNEYLEHGKSGWLFDDAHREAIPVEAVEAIRRAAYEQVRVGRAKWEADQPKILDFIDSAPVPSRRRDAKSLFVAPVAWTISAATPIKKRLFG